MKVGLIDVDSHNFPNLALMKLSAYHKSKGDEVEFVEYWGRYDIVYKSKIFDFTNDVEYGYFADEEIIGGTGYNIKTRLPQEVENEFPDYSLYPDCDFALGFLTRGCPRNCDFCIVTSKEGSRSVRVSEITGFWNGQNKIKLLDSNLLACKERIDILKTLIGINAKIDFSQGLDIRLINEEIIEILMQIKIYRIHFAYDQMKNQELIEKNLRMIKKITGWGRGKVSVYVLVNFDTNFREDFYRIIFLKQLNFMPYIMIFNKKKAPMKYHALARWCNCPFLSNLDFNEYHYYSYRGDEILKTEGIKC